MQIFLLSSPFPPVSYTSLFIINLQNITATNVLHVVAIIDGNSIDVGLALPYWLLYAIILTGISCIEDILITRNVHISQLATLLCPLSSDSSCIARIPAGVAAIQDQES